MAVKNITSNIKPEKTVMEIEKLLARFGAKAIMKEYLGENVSSISFVLEHQGQKIPFKMPMNVEKARRIVEIAVSEKKLPYKYRNEPLRTEKAMAVGWRLIKDWIHVSISLMEVEFSEPLEILLPYAFNPIENKTVYQMFQEKKDEFLAIEEKPE